MASEKMEEKVAGELAKRGLATGEVKQLGEFLKVVHEFSQYLAANQYYSEGLNKKVFLLNLDCDGLVLKLEKLKLWAEKFFNETEKSLLNKKKPVFDETVVNDFKKSLSLLEKEVDEIHGRAMQLIDEIRAECRQKTV
jgi:hypothetical protein